MHFSNFVALLRLFFSFIASASTFFPQILSTIVCQHPPELPSRTILDWTYSAQRFFIFSYFFFFFILGRVVD